MRIFFTVALCLSGCGGDPPASDDLGAPDALGMSCANGMKDGDETDVDCGGACPPCADGKSCLMPADCQSHTCINNLCKPSLCSDGKLDGDESDIDCGGKACAPCADGKNCTQSSDCASGRCLNNVCRPPAPGDMAGPPGDMAGPPGDMSMIGNVCTYDDPQSLFDNCQFGP